jgi:hypothetical protein
VLLPRDLSLVFLKLKLVETGVFRLISFNISRLTFRHLFRSSFFDLSA